jgi:pimeloyl-ACP methyl ester carboxylesterase
MTPRSAWARTFVLLAIVLDVPVLARIVRTLTPEPRVETMELDGVPIELVLPAGDGEWPAFHFVNGAHPERRQEPIVQRVTHGLARAGFVVALPDLPGLGDGELTPRTFDAARAVTQMVANRPEVRDGRVALAGVSAGSGIALVTAADPGLAGRISVVAAVVPFADIERLACLATTSRYERDGTVRRYEVTALMRRVVARSLVAALPAGDDRSALLDLLRAQDPDDIDALLCLADPGRELGLDAQSVVSLLLNDEPERFDDLYRALPDEIVSRLRSLSPADHTTAIRAPVEAIAPPDDPYFPLPEAEAIVALVPKGNLTVTRVLDHTRPSLALARLGDFARFLRWVRRCLGAAAE